MVFYCHVLQLGEPERSCGIIVPFYTRLSRVTRMIFAALPRSFRQPQVASVGGNIPLKCSKYLQINHCPEWVGLHPLDAGEIHGKISDGQTESLTKGQTKDWMIIHSIVVLWTEWSLTTICCWVGLQCCWCVFAQEFITIIPSTNTTGDRFALEFWIPAFVVLA